MKWAGFNRFLAVAFFTVLPMHAVADEDAMMLKQGGQRLTITQDVMRTSVAYDPSTGTRISFANFEASQLGLSGLIQDAGSSRFDRRRTVITYDRGLTADFAIGIRAVWMDLAIHRQPSQEFQALSLPFDVPTRSSVKLGVTRFLVSNGGSLVNPIETHTEPRSLEEYERLRVVWPMFKTLRN